MEQLMKTEWLSIINRKRNGSYPAWSGVPIVLTEDTSEKVFDIIDTKDAGDPIVRPYGEGHATYFNGDDEHTYHLRFIKVEEFMGQFTQLDPSTGERRNWTKGMTRPDYIAYDLSASKAYFIIHELSTGKIQNKKADAMKQLLNMIKLLSESNLCKEYCQRFANRLCFVSANGCVTASPCDMAQGFMEAYTRLPDPLPLPNSSIESRGFKAYQTNAIKL